MLHLCCFPERVGAEVVECACLIELPDLKVCYIAKFYSSFQSSNDKKILPGYKLGCPYQSSYIIVALLWTANVGAWYDTA